MFFTDSEMYTMQLNVDCSKNVINLLTLTPSDIETCLSESFSIPNDYSSENYNLRDDAVKVKALDSHYQNPNVFIDGASYH